MNNLCMLECQRWNRTLEAFFKYLVNTKDEVLGRILTYWFRIEFQTAGALGNLLHVHRGITLVPGSTSARSDALRVSCRIQDLFDQMNLENKELIEKGFFKDHREIAGFRTMIDEVTQHECHNAWSRCMKRFVDGKLICRVPRHPPFAEQMQISRLDKGSI